MLSLQEEKQSKLQSALVRLDHWMQTMRGSGGYTGPISHWWESSLLYCGSMADWRYEGIVRGYTALFRATRQRVWLERAIQAGDDLLAAQLPSGKFRNSAFQQGPIEGGTPHEAACDAGLLDLTRILRELGDPTYINYFEAAQNNIGEYIIGELWNGQGFCDQPWNATLVPNKNATTIEALALYETLANQDMSQYLDGAAAVILAAQEKSGPRSGATVHLGTGRHRLAIGIYTARSMAGLLCMYERHPQDRWLDAVERGLCFLRALFTTRGVSFGQYPDGSFIANPRCIAGAGDVLRVMAWSRSFGLASTAEVDRLVELLTSHQQNTGGIPFGYGMAQRGSRREHTGLPEFRDVLPAVGWCDKAFRALALLAPSDPLELLALSAQETRMECTWKGQRCVYQENDSEIMLRDARTDQVIYHWSKGACYPNIYQI